MNIEHIYIVINRHHHNSMSYYINCSQVFPVGVWCNITTLYASTTEYWCTTTCSYGTSVYMSTWNISKHSDSENIKLIEWNFNIHMKLRFALSHEQNNQRLKYFMFIHINSTNCATHWKSIKDKLYVIQSVFNSN